MASLVRGTAVELVKNINGTVTLETSATPFTIRDRKSHAASVSVITLRAEG
jgi:hypothetical protein